MGCESSERQNAARHRLPRTCRSCEHRGTQPNIRAPTPHTRWPKRSWLFLLAALLSLSAPNASADESPTLPHRFWLPGFGGLCDGGPLTCTRIDEFAFNARADAMLSTSTDRRGFALVAPYGFSFALLERLEGGVFSHTAIWKQPVRGGDELRWHQGPLRFAVKGLLWPWRSDPHQHLSVVASFDQEARLWLFDGPNQLGLLTDLAALRLSLNKPLGIAELGLQVGALFDWQGRFGTAELGARVGFHLPFLPEVKAFAEGAVRGMPRLTYVQSSSVLPGARDPANPISVGGVLSLGIVARPKKQIDFAMAVSVGFGDTAPFMLTLRGPLDFSIGKGYPYPQSLAADILREAGAWIVEQIRKLPEPVRETCVLYGRDGQPIATLGTLTNDGEHCEFQGKLYRVGDKLYPDAQNRRVCMDAEGTNCVAASAAGTPSQPPAAGLPGSLGLPPGSVGPGQPIVPPPNAKVPGQGVVDPATLAHLARSQGALGMVRGQLDDQCILTEGNQQVAPVGHRSADGKHCVIDREVKDHRTGKIVRTERQEIPVGQHVYRDPSTGRVCTKESGKSKRDCPVAIDPDHNRPMSTGQRSGYHGAIGLTKKAEQYADAAKQGVAKLSDPAELSTTAIRAGERAASAAKSAVETLRDPAKAKDAARGAWHATVDTADGALRAAQHWWNKPPEKKLDDLAEAGGGGLIDVPVNMATGAVVGGVVRSGEAVLEVADELRKAERAAVKGRKAARVLEEAEHTAPVLPKGGTYLLKDPETGQIVRTGRTKDHQRRKAEHLRHPETEGLEYHEHSYTDDYAAKRGHEQLLHDEHQPPLNKIRPIDPNNPRREEYLDAGRKMQSEPRSPTKKGSD